MTCRHVEHLRDAYQDGELSSNLAAEVHAHLLACRECQQHFDMLRIAGEVIARDDARPLLDSGFASRVVANMTQNRVLVPRVVVSIEDERRWPWRRLFLTGSVPAAAAALFVAILIWPTSHTPQQPHGAVAGVQYEATDLGVKDGVAEVLTAVKETRDAFHNFGKLGQVLGDEARAGVRTDQPPPARDLSLLDVFLEPFNDVLVPAEAGATGSRDDAGIVRF